MMEWITTSLYSQENYIMIIWLIAIWAIIIDLVMGDPNIKLHPVMLIGNAISYLKRKLRTGREKLDRFNGFLIIVIVSTISSTILIIIQLMLWTFWGSWAKEGSYTPTIWDILILTFISGFILKWSFAIKNLGDVVKPIKKNLEEGNIKDARKRLSWIVRRNTQELDEQHILSATIEVIAESSSDAVTGVFWFYFTGSFIGALLISALGSFILLFLPVIFAYIYRVINTGDSVVGYKDEENINIGWFSAKSDDVSNYIPTRITVFCMFVAGKIMKLNTKSAKYILKRDKNITESINAGWTMGFMAGLLNVQLEKKGKYKLGDPNREMTPLDILTAYKCTRLSMLLFIIFVGIIISLVSWRII